MRHTLALLCLTGALLFAGLPAPERIARDPPEAFDVAAPDEIVRPDPHALNAPLAADLGDAESDAPDDDAAAGSVEPKAKSSLERARAALGESHAPALSDHEICTRLVAVAQANNLPLGFFANLIWRESHFDLVAISKAGAMGIAQFMPDVADRLGLNAFDARDALPASGRLLATLRERFGNLGLVAAAYNAGPKRVSNWLRQRAGLPRETRAYVSLITGKDVEQWRDLKAKTVVFSVPLELPCHRSAEFSALANAERIEQLQQIAEERSRLKRRHAPRLLAKAKPRAMIASR